MTITAADIKIMASERLNDDPDGGGYMTGTVIQDGVENNIFPDISDLDRTQGAMDFRKVFAAVLTTTQDTYFGAHAIIDVVPEDEAISGILVGAASVSEQKSELVARLSSGPFYGTLPLAVAAAFGDKTLSLPGIHSALIPKIETIHDPETKPLSQFSQDSPSNQLSLVPVGSTITYSNGDPSSKSPYQKPIVPGTFNGTGTWSGSAVTITEDLNNNNIKVTRNSDSAVLQTIDLAAGHFSYAWTPHANLTAWTVNYQRALPTWLPRTTEQMEITSANSRSTYTITIPTDTVPGSEQVTWTNHWGVKYLRNGGGTAMRTSAIETGGLSNWDQYTGNISGAGKALFGIEGEVDRDLGRMAVSLGSPTTNTPTPGTMLKWSYVPGGFAQSVDSSALSNAGVVTAGVVTIDTSSGFTIADVEFMIGSTTYKSRENGDIIDTGGIVRGLLDRTAGTITMVGQEGNTLTNWFGVEMSSSFSGQSIDVNVGSNLDQTSITIAGETSLGASFTADSNDYGGFSTSIVTGSYTQSDGMIRLTFSESVNLSTLEYTASEVEYTMPDIDTDGLSGFLDSGKVPLFQDNQIVVLHNTQSTSPATVSNGTDVNLGRTLLSRVRVFGDNGNEITTGFTVNKVTGHVVFSDVSGYSQPVTIEHRVEDMAVMVSVDSTGAATLSRQIAHDYPVPGSYISSALVIGDMQARVHGGFQQVSWTGVWSDAQIGGSITADYNEAANPIVINNKGGITERWAIIFLTTTTFKVVGEQVGEILQGSITTATAPLNPATLEPFFSIPSAGWGSGWAVGNVYRFNTVGASAPLWLIRAIKPSDPFDGQDKISLAMRGNIDA